MAIPAISIRNFVADGNIDDIEGVPSHLIDQGSFSGSPRVWFRKTMESERIARLEVLAQEFFRLLLPNQPETNLGWDENTQQFYVLSEAVDRFHPLPKHQKQKFTNGSYRGLGMILIIAIFLQEVDLRNTNLGLNNKNEVIKIDGDWCFAALRDPIVWENLPRDITPQLIESLPYPMGIHTYHWIGLVKNGLAQVDSDYINPTELTHAPYFRAEINQAILQLLLIPEEYLNAFISTFIEEDANSYFEFMQSRTQQLRESALQNESFREYLASEQALVDAEAHLQRLKSFETNEKLRMIQPSEHSKINTKIHTQLRELRNSVGCNNRIIPRDANQNRDKKHGYRWLPENLSFGFLSGFLGASLVTTSLILLQIIDILTLGFGAALTATATIGIIVLPALLMGGLGYLIEASCTKPVRNPKVDKDGNSPDLIYDFSKEIQDFEEALAGLRRANGEHNIYSHTPKPKNFSIPDEPNERLGNAIFDLYRGIVMIKASSLFGFVPSTQVQDNSNIRHLTKFKDNVQKAVDVNNAIVQQIWHLKLQAAKTKSPLAQTVLLEEIDRLEGLLNASQAQEKIKNAIEEVKEMEVRLAKEEHETHTVNLHV